MNIKQFNKLPKEEQLRLLCKRIEEMKKEKLTTREFTNEEFNFSWPSQRIKEMGYWLDQADYILRPYARDGEMVISKKEYQKLVASQEENKAVNKEEYEKIIASLKKQIEELKMQASIEELISPYLNGKNITYYTKIPKNMVDMWNEFAAKRIYGKHHTFEIALIKYMKKYNKEDIFSKAKHFNDLSSKNIEYQVISINASESLIKEWKDYCKEVQLFTAAQFTTDALMEMMNIQIEDFK